MDINLSSPIFTPSVPRTWPPLLNIKQTAQILNISPWTLRQWDKKGKFTAIRIGSRKDRRYKREDVIKIVQEGIK